MCGVDVFMLGFDVMCVFFVIKDYINKGVILFCVYLMFGLCLCLV